MKTITFTRLLPRFDAGATAANSAISTGQSAINSYDPTATAGAAKASSGNLFDTQLGQTKNYVNDYSTAVAKNPTVTSLYNTANDMFNVPQLAENATNLTNRVHNILPAAYGGARGFDIGATQINNGAAQTSAYLTPQANAATANYNTAAGLASNFVQAGQAQNAQNLLPIQSEAPLLQGEQNTQGQIWNTATQSEFEGLLAKMNAGITLSQAELQRAQQLSQLEEDYNKAKLGVTYQTVAPGSALANTMTGAIYKNK